MELETVLFSEASIEELKKGYIEDKRGYTCILCGDYFAKGEIYPIHGKLYDAHRAVLLHIKETHHSVLDYMLKLQSSSMGLSELQLELVNLFAGQLSDKEIAEYLGVAGSTIRNHRYKLREKEKQAKIFIALMQLLEEHKKSGSLQEEESVGSYEVYKYQSMPEKEKHKVLDQYLSRTGRLESYPSSEKGKKVILEYIADQFEKGESYNEVEVNKLLSNLYIDYKLLKRELLEYGFMGKTDKGNIYWVKGA